MANCSKQAQPGPRRGLLVSVLRAAIYLFTGNVEGILACISRQRVLAGKGAKLASSTIGGRGCAALLTGLEKHESSLEAAPAL